MTRIASAVVAACALLLVGAAPAPRAWVPAWTASMWQATSAPQEVRVENATVRFAVRLGAAGSAVRLRLSNEYGDPLRIGAASVRVGDRIVPVTFGRQRSTNVAGHGSVTTDAAALPVRQFDVAEVSLFFPDAVRINTVHAASGDKTLISTAGDHSAEPFAADRRTDMRPLLAVAEVLAPAKRPVVVAYGDSITDNTGCAMDAVPACRWGDVLARRLAAAGKPHVVVTQAISGNRVLVPGTGPSALERFNRDVLSLPGVSHIVLLEGINDIGNSGRARPDGTTQPTITAPQLIAGYRELVARAHRRGIKVMALTVLPYKGAAYQTEAGEAMRIAVNNWIRTSGTFDGVFDMEKAVADPSDPQRLNPDLQRGDNLHPDGRGETRMGEAIPLAWFR